MVCIEHDPIGLGFSMEIAMPKFYSPKKKIDYLMVFVLESFMEYPNNMRKTEKVIIQVGSKFNMPTKECL